MSEFTWNNERRLAAQLVADGNLTHTQIAERCGVTRQSIWLWRQSPEFTQVVEEMREEFKAEVVSRGVALREKRVNALNDRWNHLNQVIEERAADATWAHIPGWTTGLLVHDVKMIGSGDSARRVDLFTVDVGLLREIREHERQAAQEFGQWTEKHEVEQTAKAYISVTPEDL